MKAAIDFHPFNCFPISVNTTLRIFTTISPKVIEQVQQCSVREFDFINIQLLWKIEDETYIR